MLRFNGIEKGGNDKGKSREIGRRPTRKIMCRDLAIREAEKRGKAADPKRMRKDSRATESLLKRFR